MVPILVDSIELGVKCGLLAGGIALAGIIISSKEDTDYKKIAMGTLTTTVITIVVATCLTALAKAFNGPVAFGIALGGVWGVAIVMGDTKSTIGEDGFFSSKTAIKIAKFASCVFLGTLLGLFLGRFVFGRSLNGNSIYVP